MQGRTGLYMKASAIPAANVPPSLMPVAVHPAGPGEIIGEVVHQCAAVARLGPGFVRGLDGFGCNHRLGGSDILRCGDKRRRSVLGPVLVAEIAGIRDETVGGDLPLALQGLRFGFTHALDHGSEPLY